MACNVRIQPTALRELDAIVDYLRGFGAQAASSFLDEWDAMLERLHEGAIEYPLSRFDALARLGYRAVLVKGYVALYFCEGDCRIIAHVFHQSQDYASIVLRGL